jgi:2,3-bisphosphoglycerate-independent phosphoglycerate mutase
MKYIVLVGDGMADVPVHALDGRTPLEAAKTPNMDTVARTGLIGRVKTIPQGMTPASDVANLSIMGYDCRKYYTGRGPLEAVNLGVRLDPGDVAFRCNLVTVVRDVMEDYSAGHISSDESHKLISYINERIGNEQISFYPGVGYRHLMVVKGGVEKGLHELRCQAPHDILGKDINPHMPRGRNAEYIVALMQQSRTLLESHEINLVRVDLKENPATMIWLWGQGQNPAMPKFSERFGVSGGVISAVDLIKGLGRVAGLEVIVVPGATGYYDTDYLGKARAAVECLRSHDFVYVHVEAPDEAGHNGDLREKITAIERFDHLVVGTVLKEFASRKDWRVLVLPDHATPVTLRTHTAEPVLFAMCGEGIAASGAAGFSEKEAAASHVFVQEGHALMDMFMGRNC